MTLGAIFTGLGYAVGALVFYWASRERHENSAKVGRLAAIGFFFGILGAKITELVAEGASLSVLFQPSLGGRALFGGLVFGWLAVEIAKWRMGIKTSTGALFALALPAGEAVGRIGCYFNGCCYGTACDLPWSVYQHGAQRHPSQLYSAGFSLFLFAVLMGIRKRVDSRALFRYYLLGWGLGRFVLEFFREGNRPLFGLTFMQAFALETALGAAAISIIVLMKSGSKAPKEAS